MRWFAIGMVLVCSIQRHLKLATHKSARYNLTRFRCNELGLQVLEQCKRNCMSKWPQCSLVWNFQVP